MPATQADRPCRPHIGTLSLVLVSWRLVGDDLMVNVLRRAGVRRVLEVSSHGVSVSVLPTRTLEGLCSAGLLCDR